MKLSDIPSETFPIPFGFAAGGGYIRTVPEASQIGIQNGAASLTDGFVPLNFLPVGAGGVPPFGQDMNGILNQITAWSRWQNAGGTVVYDGSFSGSINGYPRGAIVASATNSGVLWLCLADDNITDPDSASSSNWASLFVNSSSLTPVIYVRTDGNDSNSGNANNAGSAMATIAAAITRLKARYFLGGNGGIIQLGNSGTYAAPGQISAAGGSLQIIGDISNQSNYIISGPGPNPGPSGLIAVTSGLVTVKGVTVTNPGTIPINNNLLVSGSGSSLIIENVTCLTSLSTVYSLLIAASGGSVSILDGCIMGGSAQRMFAAQAATITILGNIAVTNSPSYSSATVEVTSNGALIIGNVAFTFSGTGATGVRYRATLNGVINTLGSGPNYFPGSTAGSTATGGQYN